jgi:EpsI family protein
MWRTSTIVMMLLATTFLNGWLSTSEGEQTSKSLKAFPSVIGDWRMKSDQLIDDKIINVLLVDDYMMRSYENKQGDVVNLYVGYFKSQREGKGIHSPRLCLPGAGWERVSHSVQMMAFKYHYPSEAQVNVDVMGKGNDRELYVWWYQGRGRIYADEYWNKVYLVWDAIAKRRTDGALVRVNSKIGSEANRALSAQEAFISSVMPELSRFIPQ